MLVKATIPFATADFNATAGEFFELEGETLKDLLSTGLVEKVKSNEKKSGKGNVKK